MTDSTRVNPLIHLVTYPDFLAIQATDIEPAIDTWLARARTEVAQLITLPQPAWADLAPLQAVDDGLGRAWSWVSHLNAVMNRPEYRAAYQACLPKLSAYWTWFNQHPELYRVYQSLAEHAELTDEQRRALTLSLREFSLSGIDLPAQQQARFAEIEQRLSSLSDQFSNQVLDATQAWHYQITDPAQLDGLPESARQAAAAAAAAKGLEGWVLTLDFPSYYPVITYADNRALREILYTAYVTRASDQGPLAGRWDNAPLMEEILALRQEKAALLGFAHYADYSLARKMAPSASEVEAFLTSLAERAQPQAQQDMEALRAFAATEGVTDVQPWDLGYFAEKLRQQRYQLDQEALKPWFAVPQVLRGLFRLVTHLFQVECVAAPEIPTWHPDVQVFHLLRSGETLASFYLDLYARDGKRGGAWMANGASRRRDERGQLQLPIAFLTCNFTPPLGGEQPSLLTHQEVTTLFHEFGHGLHHLLTQIEVADVAGIHGVAWDAVELPSQFMENFCWERASLAWIAAHQETGGPLPDTLLNQLLGAKHFHASLQLLRQLELALFDFLLHQQCPVSTQASITQAPMTQAQIQTLINQLRARFSPVPVAEFNRFQNSFSHIFAGGYAAGYYSYKWAEVLSADAFSAFEEEGILNAATGERFRRCILERGGAEDAMTLFTRFRGRAPSIEALLRHQGMTTVV